MARVTGIGGVFFKARDAEGLRFFPDSSTYFSPSSAPFMINYRVDDLSAVLAELRAEGCAVEDRVDESEFGRFGWVQDPEGNRVELWEPPAAG